MNFEEIRKYFENTELKGDKVIVKNSLHDFVEFVSQNYGFDILKSITAIDNENNETELIYHLYSEEQEEDLLLSQVVSDETESVTDIFQSAIADENEIFDLFGVKFTGNENLKRLYMPEDWEGFPLRKDYIESDTRLAWNDKNNA